MKALLRLKENNFENKNIIPEVFFAEIEGSKVLKISSLHDFKDLLFYFDLKKICFLGEYFVIEGIISDSQKLLGRCVFSINEPKSQAQE